MKASYKKETRPDPEADGKTYSNYELQRGVEFCCDSFKNYCKKLPGWSYEQGKFGVVGEISYEGHSISTIDFCPFCGQKIEYEDVDSPKLKKKKS